MNTEQMLTILKQINDVLWGPLMLAFLLGTGIWFTFKLRFLQLRKVKAAARQLFIKQESEDGTKGMSSFQSLATAIAAQVGTGNLAGVATAIVSGGPGAIFWMWISGFFGMGTIFAEAVLAQEYREVRDGEFTGGPAYYIKKGIRNKTVAKLLSGFFAVTIILALGLMGNIVQSNSLGMAIEQVIPVPPIVIGLFTAVLVALILVGGITRIGAFTERVVPVMAALYILGGIAIIGLHAENVLPALKMIFVSAFTPQAALGGAVGTTVKEAVRFGVARGLFSNEAGMGSTPHAHAVAKVKHPGEQGLVSIISVIIDTGIVCTITALVILTTGVLDTGLTSAALTQEGFRVGFSNFGDFGNYFIAVCLFFFAFSTIIGWYFFGEQNVKYLFGSKGVHVYRPMVLACIVVGPLFNVDVVWQMADMFNALMVIPNLIGIVCLTGIVVKILNDYETNIEKLEPRK